MLAIGPRRGVVSGGGSWAYVQSASSYTVGGEFTPPISLAFSSNVTAGSMLVAGIKCGSLSGTISVSTSLGQSFVQAGIGIDYRGRVHSLFYLKNASAGATTVTASGSYSPGTYFDYGGIPFVLAEYSGLSTTSPLADQATKSDGGNYYSMTTTSVTATANGLLLVLASNDEEGRAIVPDAGFTSRASVNIPTNPGFQLLEWNAPTSAGATGSLTAGTVPNSYWSTVAAAFSL